MAYLSLNARETGNAAIVFNTPNVNGGRIDLIIPLITSDDEQNLLPYSDTMNLGSPTCPWNKLYVRGFSVQTSPVLTVTDTEGNSLYNKKNISIPNELVSAWKKIAGKVLVLTNDKKNRIKHVGYMLSNILDAFDEAGIDPYTYGIIEKAESGEISINYDEALILSIEALRGGMVDDLIRDGIIPTADSAVFTNTIQVSPATVINKKTSPSITAGTEKGDLIISVGNPADGSAQLALYGKESGSVEHGGSFAIKTGSVGDKMSTVCVLMGDPVTGKLTWNGDEILTLGSGSAGYLPLSGGTLTGALTGTTAAFTGKVLADNFIITSDSRVKENLIQVESCREKISKIAPYTFNYIQDSLKTPHIGVIAQDVEKVMPEAVNILENGIKTVSYMEIVPVLAGAMNELSDAKISRMVIDAIYPVGSVYLCDENVDPNVVLGNTWKNTKKTEDYSVWKRIA